MKACPHCGGEIRPSVIKCVHCGLMVKEPAQAGVGAATAPAAFAGPDTAPDETPTPAPGPPPQPRRPVEDLWVTPSTRQDGAASPSAPPPPAILHGPARPPAVRVRAPGVDLPLMASALLLLVSATVAYLSLSMRWAQIGVLTEVQGSPIPRKVVDLGLTARDSLAWRIGLGLAVAFVAWGVVWFWCALDRGSTLPRLAHPKLAILAAGAGLALALLARFRTSFWNQGLIEHAHRAGLTRVRMHDLLAQRPAPTIEVEVLEGLFRFGLVMALVLGASLVAWWAVRRRA